MSSEADMDPFLPDPPPEASGAETFEQIWEIRDEVTRRVWGDFQEVYTRATDGVGPYVYLSEIPPAAQAIPADRWTYVTGGLALPWADDLSEVNAADYSATVDQVDAHGLAAAEAAGLPWSGLGFELALHTPRQAPWAVHVLHNLGTHALRTGVGFAAGQRIPLDGPIINGSDSAIRVLLLAPPGDRAPVFRIPSGLARWLVAIGVTLDEWELAQREGSAALLAALRSAGVNDLTDPDRASILGG
jgi:hypothetical protein